MWKLLLWLMLPAAGAAQTCTPNVQQRAATVLSLQAKLLAARSPDMETDIPVAIKPLLHDFKQALIDTVDTGLRCNNPDPLQAQADFAALLHANLPEKPFVPQKGPSPETLTGAYGDEIKVNVQPVAGQPGLFSLQLSYDVECGNDNILLLYRRGSAGWHRVLVWQNPDLNSVGDAYGDMFYFAAVPAPEPAFVVVAGTPWCTSNMSMFKADLVAPATATRPQHLLEHITRDYRREDASFKLEPDGFELRTWVNSVANTNDVMRPAVLRYVTTTGHFVQQPVAPNAQAFVDLWLESEWKAVNAWSDSGSQPRLEKIHDDMGGEFADFIKFGPTLACAGHYQVELDLQADHTTSNLQIIDLPSKYAEVRTNANTFTLLDITDKADPTCHGPDLMAPAAGAGRKRAK